MIELEVIGTDPVELDVIMSSGIQIENQNKTVTPTESEQSVTADPGYTGLGIVTVEGIDPEYVGSDIPRRYSADLTVSGAAVSVPAGYYENSAGTSVSSGSVGTPTATKGTVAGHAIAVTPSVTSSAGYIAGGTKTGSAVSVSAAELVSGTKAITANGTEDVTNYASVSVSVPNSYSASDEGKVVDNGELVAQTSETITVNGTYDTTLKNEVTVNVSGGVDYLFEINNFSPGTTKWAMNLGASDYGFVNMANGDYVEVEWLETTPNNTYPNLFSYGVGIGTWTDTRPIMVYLSYNSSYTAVNPIIRQNATNVTGPVLDPSVAHTLKIDKDYVYIDGVAIVATDSVPAANTKPWIGSMEGTKRFVGTYKHIRVVKGA